MSSFLYFCILLCGGYAPTVSFWHLKQHDIFPPSSHILLLSLQYIDQRQENNVISYRPITRPEERELNLSTDRHNQLGSQLITGVYVLLQHKCLNEQWLGNKVNSEQSVHQRCAQMQQKRELKQSAVDEWPIIFCWCLFLEMQFMVYSQGGKAKTRIHKLEKLKWWWAQRKTKEEPKCFTV